MTGRAPRTSSLQSRALRALGAAGVIALAFSGAALAQIPWPFGGDQPQQRPPTPREPVYRPPAQAAPPPVQAPSAQPMAPAQGQTNWIGSRAPICTQLEQRLVQEGQRNPRELLPKLEADIRAAEKTLRSGESQLDQRCYESLLFFRTLKSTRECRDLSRQVEDDKHRLTELNAQRGQILSSSNRSLQDDIIRELARNNCGPGYAQEAKKRDGGPAASVWQDDESGAPAGNSRFGTALPYATYRTLCVRLCDGYYFPISFSTLPAHFQQDAEACQSKCAAPVALYYHQNPGGAVDQMVQVGSQEPYTKLKTAFRYRKEFVQGCSCKQAEYVPQTPASGAAPADRRADAAPPAATPLAPPANAGPLATRPR